MTASTLRVAGAAAPIEIHRDPEGIPHIRASSSGDAFFGQGFVHGQDRLFQMDYDRRRAYGRWAEFVGPSGVEADRLARRFRLESSARRDWEHASPEARAMLSAYAAGVNAFIESTTDWGLEFPDHRDAPGPMGALGQHGGVQDQAPRHGTVEGQALARADSCATWAPSARRVSRGRRSLIPC